MQRFLEFLCSPLASAAKGIAGADLRTWRQVSVSLTESGADLAQSTYSSGAEAPLLPHQAVRQGVEPMVPFTQIARNLKQTPIAI
jgi:hypothetical protein